MDATTRVCTRCQEPKPLDEFRLRSRAGNDRFRQCRACHNDAERCRRQGKKAADDGLALRRAMTGIRRSRRISEARDLVVDMIVHFEGYQAFVNTWVKWFNKLRATRPGAKGVADTFLAILRMSELVDPEVNPRLRDPDDDDYDPEAEKLYPDFSRMSTEEVYAWFEETCGVDQIRRNPAFAVKALRDMGWEVSWEVTPPAAETRRSCE